jgi:long-chain acyl-CoA synthetase
METISKFKDVSYFPAVPTMISAVLNHPRAQELQLGKRLGVFNSGAAPCPPELLKKARDMNIFIAEGWGMSETTSLGITNPYMGRKKEGSIGSPYPDVDVRILDPQTGKEMPIGQVGEIVLKSPTVMKGYWNDPEETAKVLKDGWLYTGDLAYKDEDGYFFIVDRSKDVVISGGYNIYPREIDEVLFTHPKVKDAMAVGIPDEYYGEILKVFVQLVDGAAVTAEELKDYCRQHLAAYKVPRQVEFRPELPRSAVGKALRRVLRDEEMRKAK